MVDRIYAVDVAPPAGFEFVTGVCVGGQPVRRCGASAYGLLGAEKYGQGIECGDVYDRNNCDPMSAQGVLRPTWPAKPVQAACGHGSRRHVSLPAPFAKNVYQLSELTQIRELGSGAFGKVMLARDRRDKLFAVKFAAIDKESVLSHEAQLHMWLEHPNIAQLSGVVGGSSDQPDTIQGVMMEFCAGGTLADWLEWNRGKAALPLLARLEVACQIAAALEYMHERGVCHLDLKPSNIMLTSADLKRSQAVKLADFGLSQRINGRFMPGRYRGTLPYMPPEMAIQQRTIAAPALDIWSLGVVLKELVTQAAPCAGWQGSQIKGALRARQLHVERLSCCEPEWAALVAACLSYEPSARPSAAQLRRHISSLRAAEAQQEHARSSALASSLASARSGVSDIASQLPESLGLGVRPCSVTDSPLATACGGAWAAKQAAQAGEGPWWTRPGALPELPDSLGLTSF